MSLDLIGCWNHRKLKALIPRVAAALKNREWSAISGEKDFAVFFICLNMYHGNSENSDGCPYLLRICLIYGTYVRVSRSWVPMQVVNFEEGAFWFTNKQVQVESLSMLKLVSFERLARNDFSERGTQAESHCERNLNRLMWRQVLDVIYRIAVQGIFVSIIIKITELLFSFTFCKKINQKNCRPRSLAAGCV